MPLSRRLQRAERRIIGALVKEGVEEAAGGPDGPVLQVAMGGGVARIGGRGSWHRRQRGRIWGVAVQSYWNQKLCQAL